MKTTEYIKKFFIDQEIDTVFALPGEENLDLLDTIEKSEIRLVVSRHESAAAFMANNYARLTGKIGVCITTLGPGMLNSLTGHAQAKLEGNRTLYISAAKKHREHNEGYFQSVDTENVVSYLSENVLYLNEISKLPSFLNQLRNGEKQTGPRHLILPEDIASDIIDTEMISYMSNDDIKVTTRDLSHDDHSNLIERINQSKKPIIILGPNVNNEFSSDTLKNFIDKTNIPFLSTQMGKGAVDERHQLYCGTTALSSDDWVHELIEDSDLILAIGLNAYEKPPFLKSKSSENIIVHIDYNSAMIHNDYMPKLQVVGDVRQIINSLVENVTPKKTESEGEHKKNLEYIEEQSKEVSSDQSIEKIVHEVRDNMPSDGILCLDNGLYKVWFSRNYKCYAPQTLILDNTLATMGAGLPNAISSKLIHPDKRVMAICGDGGFLMNSQELSTARKLNLDITVLVLKDDSYGMIEWKQNNQGYKNDVMDLMNPDFLKLGEAYGVKSFEVSGSKSLKDCMEEAYGTTGVSLIVAPVDYFTNYYTLPEKLKESYEVRKSN